MRVIAGTARGRQLVAPRGGGTRPIADRVKETLFAILGERVEGAEALDLYAGSGAIGIEALSRGASACDFVEKDRRAMAAIRENLDRLGFAERATLHQAEVMRYLAASPGGRWSLAFLDPPYAERDILAPLQRLVPGLARGATVVVKHHWRTPIPEPPGLTRWRERRFGESSLTFLTATGEGDGMEEP